MATERQAPDAILVQTNLSGTVSAIQDDPDSPDANWLTAPGSNNATEVRVSFPTPSGIPNVGAGLQNFRVQVRKTNHSTDPTCTIELYESGSALSTLVSAQTVSSTTGVVIQGSWNASLLGTSNGASVECRVTGATGGGNPNNRASLEVGAIEWNVDYTPATAHSGATVDNIVVTQTTDGSVGITGGTTDSVVVTQTTNGLRTANGATVDSVVVTQTTDGSVGVAGATVDSVVVTQTTDGSVGVAGATVDSVVVTQTTDGLRTANGATVDSVVVTQTTNGLRTANGATVDSVVVTQTTDGSVGLFGATNDPIIVTQTNQGVSSKIGGTSDSVVVTQTTDGLRTANGATVDSVVVTQTTNGSIGKPAATNDVITITTVVSGKVITSQGRFINTLSINKGIQAKTTKFFPTGKKIVKVTSVNNNEQLKAGNEYAVDVSSGGFTLKVPISSVNGDRIVLRAKNGAFSTNNLTIDTDGADTLAGSDSIVVNTDDIGIELIYDAANTNWRVFTVSKLGL